MNPMPIDGPEPDAYDGFYEDFETPLMQQIRREVYGEDIGLHSWGTVQELRGDLAALQMDASSRIADLGSGPCGALTAMLATVGCRGTAVDRSGAALRTGQARATRLGLAERLEVQRADLNRPLPFADRCFDAVQAVDTVPHLQDRGAVFHEVARILKPGGRFLCLDSCVLTGAIANGDLERRLAWGYTQIAAPGWNERLLEAAGFQVIAREDRSEAACRSAQRKAAVHAAHRAALEQSARWLDINRYLLFLETAARLYQTRQLARQMVLAIKRDGPA